MTTLSPPTEAGDQDTDRSGSEEQPATAVNGQIASVLGDLVELTARQIIRTADLEREVERLRHELVVVKSQEVVRDVLRDLADRGYSAGPNKIRIRTEGTRTEAARESHLSHTESDERTLVEAKIGGLLKKLGSLGGKVETDAETLARTLERTKKSRREEQKTELSWETGGISAPSLEEAKAFERITKAKRRPK